MPSEGETYLDSSPLQQEQDRYGHEQVFRSKQAYHRRNLLPLLRPVLQRPSARVLEFGPGHGELAQIILREFPAVQYWAVDNDAIALQSLNQRFPRITIVCAQDPKTLSRELEGVEFDAVFSADVWEHLPADFVLDYTSCSVRLLREEGIFVAQVPNLGCLFGAQFFASDLTHRTQFNELSAKQLLLQTGAEETAVLPFRFPKTPLGLLRELLRGALNVAYYLSMFIVGTPRLSILTPNLIMYARKQKNASHL